MESGVARGRYNIEDEPLPGGLVRFVVSPMWPLFATMLAGSLFGLTWFALNGFFLGSPSRRRELAWAIAGFLAAFLSALTVLWLAGGKVMSAATAKYLLLLPLAVKLAVAYFIFALQRRSFALFEYYGGAPRSGLRILIAGMLAPFLLGFFVGRSGSELHPILRLLLS